MKYSCLKNFYPQDVKTITVDDCELILKYTSSEREYDIIRNDVAIIDGFGYEKIVLKGNDAEEFLNKHLTKDIVFLNYGSIVECMLLDECAKVIAFVFVYKYDDHFLVLVPPEKKQDVYRYLSVVSEGDVKIELLSDDQEVLFLEGPKSWKMVRDILNVEIDALALRSFSTILYKNETIEIARIGRSGEYGYAIISKKDTLKDIVTDCLNNTFDLLCDFCGLEVLYLCMLEIHQPNMLYEDTSKYNLFELGYQWFIQYDKESYSGKTKAMELFECGCDKYAVGFMADCVDSNIGTETSVWLYDEKVGEIIYYIYHPQKKCLMGMTMLSKKIAVSGVELVWKTGLSNFTIKTLSSPYVRPLSWDEKIEY